MRLPRWPSDIYIEIAIAIAIATAVMRASHALPCFSGVHHRRREVPSAGADIGRITIDIFLAA